MNSSVRQDQQRTLIPKSKDVKSKLSSDRLISFGKTEAHALCWAAARSAGLSLRKLGAKVWDVPAAQGRMYHSIPIFSSIVTLCTSVRVQDAMQVMASWNGCSVCADFLYHTGNERHDVSAAGVCGAQHRADAIPVQE